MSVTIPLTRGYVAIVDDADAEKVRQYPWRVCPTRRSLYALTTITTANGRKNLYMHRLIAVDGKQTSTVVDHINGNGLDNRRANLRECTIADNTRNKKAVVGNSSTGCTGVMWRKDRQIWLVQIVLNNKKKFVGHFRDKQDAIAARLKAEQEYYGEFAPTYTPPALQAEAG